MFIIIIFYFQKQTVTANSNHNQAARKSKHDQQSWLPMIAAQWYYYAIML